MGRFLVFLKTILITICFMFIVYIVNLVLYDQLGLYILDNIPSLFYGIESIEYLIYFVILFLLRKQIKLLEKKGGEYRITKVFHSISLSILCFLITDIIYNFEFIFLAKDTPVLDSENNPISFYILFYFINNILLTPILEELVFRRIIFQSLIREKRILISLLFSSFLFTLIHIDFVEYDYYLYIATFLIGIVLGVIYYKYGLLYSVLFHLIFNLLTFVIKLNQYKYWNVLNEMNFDYKYWIIQVISLSGIIYILYKLLKENPVRVIGDRFDLNTKNS